MFVIADVEILGLWAIFEMVILQLEVILLDVSVDFTSVHLVLDQHFAVKNIDDEVNSNTDESWLTGCYVDTEIELLRLLRRKAKWKRASLIVASNFLTI